MSISFACPECKAQIEVGDEFAGHSGQCPRCERVIVIPSPNQQKPRPVGVGTATVPPTDPWAEQEARPKSSRSEERARPRRNPPAPRPPAGPTWPWVVGIIGAVVVIMLLFSSFIVLVSWRKAEPTRPNLMVEVKPAPAVLFKAVVIAGRLDGQRATLQNGIFQIRDELTANDPKDQDHLNSRCKRYDVTLQGGRDYVVELDTQHFDSELRLENLINGKDAVLDIRNGNRGVRSARIEYRPQRTDVHLIYVTSPNPAFGEFTLTIRERDMPKR